MRDRSAWSGPQPADCSHQITSRKMYRSWEAGSIWTPLRRGDRHLALEISVKSKRLLLHSFATGQGQDSKRGRREKKEGL